MPEFLFQVCLGNQGAVERSLDSLFSIVNKAAAWMTGELGIFYWQWERYICLPLHS